MAVCSLGFLFFCCAAAIVFHCAAGQRLRQIVLAGTSAIFLFPLVPNERSWIWFGIVLAATYLGLVLVRARRRGSIVATVIAIVVLLFLYLKRYSLVASFIPIPYEWDLSMHPIELVGLSYMIFKFIHMLVDEWQGQLSAFSWWSYANYQFSFFTVTAGPIQRYNDFAQNWNDMDLPPRPARDSLSSSTRLLTGMIKIGVIGALAQRGFNSASTILAPGVYSSALGSLYLYPVYLYFNFSGYTDVMIGAGGLLGFRLPENFNHPYVSRNVLDFWDRWHISLSHWIRDYIFMASYKSAATRFPRAARSWSYLLLFVALFLAGVWHGTTNGFVLFGALNGLGAAATRAYGDLLRWKLGRSAMQTYLRSRIVRIIAIVITLHFVCISHAFFASDLDQALARLRAAGREIIHFPAATSAYSWQVTAIVLAAAVGLLWVLLWKSDGIGSAIERLARRLENRSGWLYAILCLQCFLVGSMFFIDWALQQAPPPVRYMAF
jgi:D-alanyl-lipoteichoic acid acyltransferase DltB (MBOAT superfamily)